MAPKALSLASCIWGLLSLSSYFLDRVTAQYASTVPVMLPLTIRSPYMHSWVQSMANETARPNGPIGQWPQLWMGHSVGWSGFVRVDRRTFVWQGASDGWDRAEATASYLTPTRSIFTIRAGGVSFNVTYLSPIEPDNLSRQSFPFSYVSIDGIVSVDGRRHSVQFAYDTTGEWLSSDRTASVKIGMTHSSTLMYHQMSLANPVPMSEREDIAEDGNLILGMSEHLHEFNATWQLAGVQATHSQFNTSGSLTNTQDGSSTQSANAQVMAFAFNVSTVTSTPIMSSEFVWAVGFHRDPAIRVARGDQVEARHSYFWSQYANIGDAIDSFLEDFPNALQRSIALDTKIMSDARAVSNSYADLVALALRLAFGSLDVTISKTGDNKFNTSDVWTFMKDIGNGRRVNAVETLFASFPAFLYLNATFAGTLLEPLLSTQNTQLNNLQYAAADMGSSYPDAKGVTGNQPTFALENCGNMLIMALAYAQKSGDGSMLARHYNLFKSWADYLVDNAMDTKGFLSADGLDIQGNSNLALKGIIGIHAMSMINQALEGAGASSSDTEKYLESAEDLYEDWKEMAFVNNRIASRFDDPSSWGLIYNIYAARLIGSNLIESSVLEAQSKFYSTLVSPNNFGIPLDISAQNRCRSDWTMYTAASISDASIRDSMISLLAKAAYSLGSNGPWPSTYDLVTGKFLSGRASPAQGAMFAPLVLEMPLKPIQATGTIQRTRASVRRRKNRPGSIAGGVVGAFVALCTVVLGLLMFLRRRRRNSEEKYESFNPTDMTAPSNYFVSYTPEPSISARSPSSLGSPRLEPLRVSEKTSQGLNHLTPLRSPSFSNASFTTQGAPAQTSSTPAPSSENTHLRSEVDALRREMLALRAVQEQHEPPPQYIPG